MTDDQDNPETAVRVAVRIRPQISKEIIDICQICTSVTPGEPQVWLGKDKAFTYDYVFDTDSTQTQVYETCVKDLVDGCFSGYNATVLAYGQTGSGKTYTMGTGFEPNALNDESQGIVPRAVHHLFDEIERLKNKADEDNLNQPEFQVKAQFLELYNEEIIDLLNAETHTNYNNNINKQIRIQQENGSIQMAGVTSRLVTTAEDAFECLKAGALSRTTASTQMNTKSSRSHAIFTLSIQQTRVVEEVETLTAKFHFVDLAGSERLKRTGATGERAKEGISINTGLLCLGNVISALGDKSKKASHIPYRDSKLTRLLQDSLGGNSRTLMIACISPSDRDFMETLNTLRYANRAKNIKNKVVMNHDTSSHTIALLKKEIQELKLEIAELKQGKRLIGDDGTEYINDMYHENQMLLREIHNLKIRNKALQEANDRNCELDIPDSSEEVSENNDIEQAEEELNQLDNDISTKEMLIAELEKTQRKMQSLKLHYESKLIQLQNQIAEIEKERDLVLTKLTQEGNKSDEKTKKVHEDYDKKIKALQSDVKKLQDAKKEHAIAMKNQAKYEQQVKKLRNEVCDMKRQKVTVMNKMKEEASRHRVTELQSTKKIAQLTKQERLKDVKIKNLEVENNRIKQTLKRKDAEVKALKVRSKSTLVNKNSRQPPKLAKNKWGNIEHHINQLTVTRQAIWDHEQQMSRDIAQRQQLSKLREETMMRLREAEHYDHKDLVSELTDDIESISFNIHYLDQNIRDCQSIILHLEDNPGDVDQFFRPSTAYEKARRMTRTPQELLQNPETGYN